MERFSVYYEQAYASGTAQLPQSRTGTGRIGMGRTRRLDKKEGGPPKIYPTVPVVLWVQKLWRAFHGA
jgi:hypothetical protein